VSNQSFTDNLSRKDNYNLSIFTTKLELILLKMPEKNPIAPPRHQPPSSAACLAEKFSFPFRKKIGQKSESLILERETGIARG
jgi:hypothetical protein